MPIVAAGMGRRVAVAAPVAAREGRGEDGQHPRPDVAPRGEGPLGPVALAPDVGHLGLAVDGRDRDEVDHRLLAARVGQLEVGPAAERVVGAGVDADAAQDAAALVDLVLLEDARLGHERAGGARLGAPAARHAGRVVEAHVERRRHEGVEADPHEVVAGGPHDLRADVGAAAAVDAARRLAEDEGVAVVADVVVVVAREAVLGDAPEAGAAVVLGLQRPERRAVLDPQAAQVAEADRLAGALQAAGALRDRLGRGCTGSRTRRSDVRRSSAGMLRQAVARLLHLGGEGHDRQELGLRLGQRLARPDRRRGPGPAGRRPRRRPRAARRRSPGRRSRRRCGRRRSRRRRGGRSRR